jgi:hypothetical protein
MTDVGHKRVALTSAVLQEALLNMPSIIYMGMRGYALYVAEFCPRE